ncbi:hypothetical protein HYU19_05850 [Candidatus Woesearchaeota archaeon]|nr:hypothetical protein [Candidatus Woesearchaeota archaeon]
MALLDKQQNKGQANDIFIYVATAVLVALVLLFGYKAIMALSKTGEQASALSFKNSLQNAIDRNSPFGREAVQDFSVPPEFTRICFIDTEKYCVSAPCSQDPNLASGAGVLIADAVAANSREAAEAGTVENIFLLRENKAPEGFVADPLTVGGGFECIPLKGKLSLRFIGKGETTQVEAAGE